MLGRVVHSADFQRMLASSPRSRSAHFAVHYVAARPGTPTRARAGARTHELSTGPVENPVEPVDDLPDAHWLGAVLPKRHARRSVTRNLLRRQIRGAMLRHAAVLPHGLWLVRLRAPFTRDQYPAAASDALSRAARVELDTAFARAARSLAPNPTC